MLFSLHTVEKNTIQIIHLKVCTFMLYELDITIGIKVRMFLLRYSSDILHVYYTIRLDRIKK